MSRLVSVLVISICLMAPVSFVNAQDHDQGHDRGSGSMMHETHGMTHEWNENEDKPWHEYLSQQHRKDHDWTKASRREQRNYWKWRDTHRDEH
jgi:hypothetical protein